jgi:hypothetical protein
MSDAYETIKFEEGERLIDSFIRENTQSKILTHWMRKVFTYLVRLSLTIRISFILKIITSVPCVLTR